MARLSTISFFGTVPPLSNTTLVSRRITSNFTVKEIAASFALNTNRQLRLYFFISYDTEAPTDKEPQGINILKQLGQVDYLVGDDERKVVKIEIKEFVKGAYIKVYAVNEDTYEHTIDAQVTVELGGTLWGLW
jgi:hypothetical protein